MEEAVSALPDAVLGYRQLGITDPADGALLNEGDGAINSSRTFWTNDFYEPDVGLPSQPEAGICCLHHWFFFPQQKRLEAIPKGNTQKSSLWSAY